MQSLHTLLIQQLHWCLFTFCQGSWLIPPTFRAILERRPLQRLSAVILNASCAKADAFAK